MVTIRVAGVRRNVGHGRDGNAGRRQDRGGPRQVGRAASVSSSIAPLRPDRTCTNWYSCHRLGRGHRGPRWDQLVPLPRGSSKGRARYFTEPPSVSSENCFARSSNVRSSRSCRRYRRPMVLFDGDRALAALQGRSPECAACGSARREVINAGWVNLVISEDTDSVSLNPARTMATLATACMNCGLVAFYSPAVLGLAPGQE
jgi:hypothetical protein